MLSILKSKIGAIFIGVFVTFATLNYLYISHLQAKNQKLITQNTQYENDLKEWKISYNALLENTIISENLLKKKKEFIIKIEKRKIKLASIISQTKEEHRDVKEWMDEIIPANIIQLRNSLRDSRKKSSADNNKTRAPKRSIRRLPNPRIQRDNPRRYV